MDFIFSTSHFKDKDMNCTLVFDFFLFSLFSFTKIIFSLGDEMKYKINRQ